MSKETNNKVESQSGALDTLKNILTGEVADNFSQQIQDVRNEIEKNRKKFDEKIEESNRAHKQEEEDIRNLIDRTRTEMEARLSSYNKQLFATIEAVNNDLSNELNKTRVYLQEQLDRIDHEKTQRAELGKMLIMMGQQLIEDGKAKE
ncbi:MAG: hypothetical protein K1X92_07800 [Bacteroidia bacterium]|nr:hypothetical protein [Bacteroidia bacterium]